jgi:hypothetical protein
MPRFVGLVDVVVAVIALTAIALPAREMHAEASSHGSDADRFALALAEARSLAQPADGAQVGELARQLSAAGFRDWAVEAAQRGAIRAKGSPTAWRALLAASVASVDRLDVAPALEFANAALAACDAAHHGAPSGGACPTWEEVRMRLYQQHLDAGVRSGIDPHHDPVGFRTAGERGLRTIRIGGNSAGLTPPAPTPSTGSAGSAATGSAAPTPRP